MNVGTAARVSTWMGLVRSLVVYWRPGRRRGLRRLYAEFVAAGDLVFDVGAHLGDRTAAFADLGARVVALEPQPAVARWLRRLVGRDARVTVRAEAVGAASGTARLAVSRRTPTVSTLSGSWRARVTEANSSFRSVRWNESVDVPVVTLDRLIETYGMPAFCKIDVEGWEAEVLAGLTRPVRGLSFEFVSGDLAGAVACVRRLSSLGPYRYNAVLGEGRAFVFDAWASEDELTRWLSLGADGASSGDVYARLDAGTEPTPPAEARADRAPPDEAEGATDATDAPHASHAGPGPR